MLFILNLSTIDGSGVFGDADMSLCVCTLCRCFQPGQHMPMLSGGPTHVMHCCHLAVLPSCCINSGIMPAGFCRAEHIVCHGGCNLLRFVSSCRIYGALAGHHIVYGCTAVVCVLQ